MLPYYFNMSIVYYLVSILYYEHTLCHIIYFYIWCIGIIYYIISLNGFVMEIWVYTLLCYPWFLCTCHGSCAHVRVISSFTSCYNITLYVHYVKNNNTIIYDILQYCFIFYCGEFDICANYLMYLR